MFNCRSQSLTGTKQANIFLWKAKDQHDRAWSPDGWMTVMCYYFELLAYLSGADLDDGRAWLPGQVLGRQREGWVLVRGQRQVVPVPGGRGKKAVVCSAGDSFEVSLLSSSGSGWYSGNCCRSSHATFAVPAVIFCSTVILAAFLWFCRVGHLSSTNIYTLPYFPFCAAVFICLCICVLPFLSVN